MLREVMGCAISKGTGDTAHANDIKSDPDELSEMTGIKPPICVVLLRSGYALVSQDKTSHVPQLLLHLNCSTWMATARLRSTSSWAALCCLVTWISTERSSSGSSKLTRTAQVSPGGSVHCGCAVGCARSHASTQTHALCVAAAFARRATLIRTRTAGWLSVDELTKMIFWDHSIVTRLVDRMASSHSISTRVVISFNSFAPP